MNVSILIDFPFAPSIAKPSASSCINFTKDNRISASNNTSYTLKLKQHEVNIYIYIYIKKRLFSRKRLENNTVEGKKRQALCNAKLELRNLGEQKEEMVLDSHVQ